MGELISRILSNGIIAMYLIFAVTVIRLLFRKAPASFRCILWVLVGIRLVMPADLHIGFGILPSGEEQLKYLVQYADMRLGRSAQDMSDTQNLQFGPDMSDTQNLQFGPDTSKAQNQELGWDMSDAQNRQFSQDMSDEPTPQLDKNMSDMQIWWFWKSKPDVQNQQPEQNMSDMQIHKFAQDTQEAQEGQFGQSKEGVQFGQSKEGVQFGQSEEGVQFGQSKEGVQSGQNKEGGQSGQIREAGQFEQSREGEYSLQGLKSQQRMYSQVYPVLFGIWLAGLLTMTGYLFIRYVVLSRQLREAVRESRLVDGRTCMVYLAEGIRTPFLFGVFSPKIYLPYKAEETYTEYVLRHELMHQKHFDHIKKLVAYGLLCVYWFHPLVWLAYVLYGKDLELACDERVVRNYDMQGRQQYSQALLYFAGKEKGLWICPIAFGEVGIKERIKKVLDYKKPAFWVTICAAVVVLVLVPMFFLNKGQEKSYGREDQVRRLEDNQDVSAGKNSKNNAEDASETASGSGGGTGKSFDAGDDISQVASPIAGEFIDYLTEQGEYTIALKELSEGYHYDVENDVENKYYYEIMDYYPAVNDAGIAFEWEGFRSSLPKEWEKEDEFQAAPFSSVKPFQAVPLRLARDCKYYACYAFQRSDTWEEKRQLSREAFYNLFMENKNYAEVYCNIKYRAGEVTQLTMLDAYPTLSAGEPPLKTEVNEADVYEEGVFPSYGLRVSGRDGGYYTALYRTKVLGKDYLLELYGYHGKASAEGEGGYLGYTIYQCSEISEKAFAAVYLDGSVFDYVNYNHENYDHAEFGYVNKEASEDNESRPDYPLKDMRAFMEALAPYLQNVSGRWDWEKRAFVKEENAAGSFGYFLEMNVLTPQMSACLDALQYTVIQDTRIENPYFSCTVPEEYVGKVGYQIHLSEKDPKEFSVEFVLDQAAKKVEYNMFYSIPGRYRQLSQDGYGVIGVICWQDIKQVLWLDGKQNAQACFVMACVEELDFEKVWEVNQQIFGFGDSITLLSYNEDRSGAYGAYSPKDVIYYPDHENEAVWQEFSEAAGLFRRFLEEGGFEAHVFPFEKLDESEWKYLKYVKEKYGTEQIIIDMRKGEPWAYEQAKELGYID